MLPLRRGVIGALWTPVNDQKKLLRRSLAAHLKFLRRAGVDGVLALGSTGEFPRFTLAEREAILAAVAEMAGPLPVLANISHIRLGEVVALGKRAERLGLRGVALMPPPFPLSQADMLEFFLRAADGVDLPFYLYNFPEVCSNRIGLDTIAAFADRARLAGVKQSGGEFTYHRPLVALGKKKGFSVFSGADTRLPEIFALGAAGAVGGLVNFVPELMVEIYRNCAVQPGSGNRKVFAHRETLARSATSLAAARMKEVGRLIDSLTFPLNVAAGIEARGLDPGAPKTVVSAESKRLYARLTTTLRGKFREWGLSPG